MKKILAIIIAAVMIAACSVTAFAETTNVSYDVQPSYTVAIPASVTLGDAAVTADITASDVILEGGKKIEVELTSASNTPSGSTFNAKNGDSTVTYTITGDSAIAIGDTVATFTADGSKTLTFSAADKSAATAAGAHTETLTFTVKVESAAVAVTGVSLDKDTLELTAGGDSATLRATVAPDDATDKTVTWESSDTSVATVADGVVTPVAAGTATITAKAGDETATCAVTVTPATRTVTFNTATDGKTINKDGVTCSDSFDRYNNLFGWGSGFSVSSGQFTKIEVTAQDASMVGENQDTMEKIEGWSAATWTGKSSTVPFGVIMGNNNPVTIVFTIEG